MLLPGKGKGVVSDVVDGKEDDEKKNARGWKRREICSGNIGFD